MIFRNRPCRFVVTVLVVFCTLSTAATAAATIIVDYAVTPVLQSAKSNIPSTHWAQYETLCEAPTEARKIRLLDSLNRVFENITDTNAHFPFYAWGATSWHVSGMGFLSPTPYGMCRGFCRRNIYAALQGNYAFSDNASVLYDGGGDWPMIGFYVAPFKTTAAASASGSFILAHDSSDGSTRLTTVEYCNVPLSAPGSSAGGTLTAQVLAYANGTIIMRYASLPKTGAQPEYMPSTGLVYSKTLRKVVPTPTAANGIVAYRFDPVFDTCAKHDVASVCTADTKGDCVWCTSTAACSASTFVAQVCPRGQWAASESHMAPLPPQQFYSVTVDFEGVAFDKFSSILPLRGLAEFTVDLERGYALFKSHGSESIVCTPGLSCMMDPISNNCNPLMGTCPNGNYTVSILGLQSAFAWGAGATVATATIEVDSEQLCNGDAAGKGVVVNATGLELRSRTVVAPKFTVQLYFDTSGVVDLIVDADKVSRGTPLVAYPPIRVGLVRYGVDDASSVMVPQGLLRSGLHVRFVPQTRCMDCGAHGRCDELERACRCLPGYYGPSCVACPVCWTGSRCDDGRAGSGACLCNGGECEEACASASGGSVPSESCARCDAVGGRCNCGVCECQGGWSGPNCNVAPADGCRAYSFDGCEVCGQHEGCVYCHDSTCFNPALSGTPGGYTCSYSTPAADTQACVTYGSRGLFAPISYANDALILSGVVSALVLLVLMTLYLVQCTCSNCRRRDLGALVAVGGTPDLPKPYRERKVIQVAFTRERMQGREVMGIPLRQVSLQRLFKRRAEAVQAATAQ
ncbi:hypothetical protein GH5_01616 [Leishmania sp. Ghana 2012 LV757]|uniref:hypothetical protein n=1 Tax=Leishmania sp. Ghana 2012 LV757 TaxID=2803181 RepID=UPI001B674B7B|nr:hypothetical protein GH5_01616 [Leishmania sp. Ghana 2012 LV757]